MHIVWINDHADFTGGCEQYIFQTVSLLNKFGISSTLLYKVGSPIKRCFTSIFKGVFPTVDLNAQINDIAPDILYIHRLSNIENLKKLVELNIPKVRFFHDHQLFCLREHKYTALNHQTCTKTLGLNCYRCLGFINKSNSGSGIKISTLKKQMMEIEINKKLDRFVVGSQYMADQLSSHGFDTRKINIAPLFTLQYLDTPQRSLSEKQLSAKHLLFVGQLVRGKGLDTLIESMALIHPDAQLTVCGTGRMEAQYKKQVKKLKLSSRVHFVGYKTQEELTLLYRQANIVIIPARSPETFCLAGLESLLQGTPVIASNVGGMKEWLKPNFNGLSFESNEPRALAVAIDKFLFNREFQTKIRSNILKDNYEKFRPKNHLSILTKLFESIMVAS